MSTWKETSLFTFSSNSTKAQNTWMNKSSAWDCTGGLVEWRKDTVRWNTHTWEGCTWLCWETPTHLSLARPALCNQFLLFCFMSVSVVFRSELASDPFGKNLLEVVSLLSALRVIPSRRKFGPVQCWSESIRFMPGPAAAFGKKWELVKDFVALA